MKKVTSRILSDYKDNVNNSEIREFRILIGTLAMIVLIAITSHIAL